MEKIIILQTNKSYWKIVTRNDMMKFPPIALFFCNQLLWWGCWLKSDRINSGIFRSTNGLV